MAVTVTIPGALIAYTGGARQCRVEPGTLEEILERLEQQFPAIRQRLCADDGAPRRHIAFFLNEERLTTAKFREIQIPDGATLSILPAVSGGSPDG